MEGWAKIITALRGGLDEAGDAAVDTRALRILDQEVRDASDALNRFKSALAEIVAEQKLVDEKRQAVEATITEHEGYALKALEQGDEALATEVAAKIAELEVEQAAHADAGAGLRASADRLRAEIKQSERSIKHLKQQVDTVKAVDNVQRAQSAVAERVSGPDSGLRTAMDSLERIKEKRALETAKESGAAELAEKHPDTSLQAKLEAAGITPGTNAAEDVLVRLKAKASGDGSGIG